MRIALSADELAGAAGELVPALERRGHAVTRYGALAGGEPADWAACSAEAAGAVVGGEADAAVVACWTGTGASIAANKVAGVRAALCTDAATARGARRWNDANVLVLSLRLLSVPVLEEILDAWFAEPASDDPAVAAALRTLGGLDLRRG